MYAAEAAFLRAEGALKGWNMGGDAKTFYEKGVRLSFEEFGVSGADDYLADATSIPGNYVDNLIAGHTGNNYTNQSSITLSAPRITIGIHRFSCREDSRIACPTEICPSVHRVGITGNPFLGKVLFSSFFASSAPSSHLIVNGRLVRIIVSGMSGN